MIWSRRRFLGISATMAGAGKVDSPVERASSAAFRAQAQATPSSAPPIELIALNRMAYGR